MPDVFISYATSDHRYAEFVEAHLRHEGLSVFMAGLSLKPGDDWSKEILRNLRESEWVIFMASASACKSPYVQQELGAALATEKKLVPVVWDMEPAQLPGWINRTQALNLLSPSQVDEQIAAIAARIKASKVRGMLIAGILVAGFMYLCLASKK